MIFYIEAFGKIWEFYYSVWK